MSTSWSCVVTAMYWFLLPLYVFVYAVVSLGREPFYLWFTFAEIQPNWVLIFLIDVASEFTTHPIEDISLHSCCIFLLVFSTFLNTWDSMSLIFKCYKVAHWGLAVLCFPSLDGTYRIVLLLLKLWSQLLWFLFLYPVFWSMFQPWFPFPCCQDPWLEPW